MENNNAFDPLPLIQQAQEGRTEVLGRLLEAYRNYLNLLARVEIGQRLQGKVDPSDLVQETFLAAHRDFADFHGTTEAELVQWLRRILGCRLVDVVRQYVGAKRRDVRLEAEVADELDKSSRALQLGMFARGSSPSEGAMRREQAVLLADRIRELPEDYAEVIILHHLEGLTFPEVARRMERSLDSVKKLWVRALARLRRSLGEQP